jgi:hypothetical protein
MSCTTHTGDFGLSGGRRKQHRREAGEASSPSERRPRRAAAEGGRPGDALLLARSGGRITDSMEREIMEKALTSDWRLLP